MERFGLTSDAAFQTLVAVSQSTNVRVYEVARQLIARHEADTPHS